MDTREVQADRMVKSDHKSSNAIEIYRKSFSWGVISKEDKTNDKIFARKTIADIITLKEIDFQVKKGEFVCIIGDVGSGKSSLLSSLIGDLLYVTDEFKGKELSDDFQDTDLVQSVCNS